MNWGASHLGHVGIASAGRVDSRVGGIVEGRSGGGSLPLAVVVPGADLAGRTGGEGGAEGVGEGGVLLVVGADVWVEHIPRVLGPGLGVTGESGVGVGLVVPPC